ncbi:MAG: PLP-dependent transferase [Candidatus Eremiobacteraeota bacterium]|nr:PLP-dependent transferase [Candidatus Eremiobacteraeota bacterium]
MDKPCPDEAEIHVDTAAVHAGTFVTPANPSSSPPLFAASSYAFGDLDQMEEIYAGRTAGSIYGRYGGPNTHHFASAIAELEGAEAGVAAASGMAAIDAAWGPILRPGDRIVASTELYGGTYDLLEKGYRERGFEVVFVAQGDLAALEAAVKARAPKIVHVETLSNPLVHVTDLEAVARVAHAAGALCSVDATFTTPILGRPLRHGADLVVHSVGKYLGGHADVGLGVLCGRAGPIAEAERSIVRHGACASHFDAWLALRGVRTLGLRMARHSANARDVAAFLSRRPEVAAVHHPSLPAHPQHALAQRLYPQGTGGMLAFDLRGGAAAVDRFLRELRRIQIVHSLGEVATTISYSVRSSHRFLTDAQRAALGVCDGTLRLSCGIEDARDIVADLERALAKAGSGVRV